MKQYINTKTDLQNITVASRYAYYVNRSLISSITSFSNNDDPLLYLTKENAQGLMLEPFWEDAPVKVEDAMTQKLLDIENIESKKYVDTHPTFGLALRSNVHHQLIYAQSLLPKDICIVLKAGYRPIAIQLNLFTGVFDLLQKKFSDKSEEDIYTMTAEYVTDPRKFIPPHATGAAVDIVLWDKTNKTYLDMGSPVNYPDEKSWTCNMETLTDAQKQHRFLITNTMLQAGFANLASEWWHYSYGDQRWAIFYDKPSALYNAYIEK